MKRNLFWLFLFFSSFLWGDNVTISQAEQLARNFFGGRVTTRSAETGLEYGMAKMYKRVPISPLLSMFLIVLPKEVLLSLRATMQ